MFEKPTYKILDIYDHLIAKADGKSTMPKLGDLLETTDEIKKIIREYYKQVEKLALHLRGETVLETAYNIWHFCRPLQYGGQINYKLDKYGTEELRTPARTWAHRKKGVDCDDYAIFISSLLINLGIEPQLVIIAQNNIPNYSHIYIGLGVELKHGIPSGGIVIDPVMPETFNKHPENITKAKIMSLEISKLSGLGQLVDPFAIVGMGLLAPPDAYTKALMDYQSKLIADAKKTGMKGLGALPLSTQKEMTKIRTMIALNATPERDTLKDLMPYVDHIKADGSFVFRDERIAKAAMEYLQSLDGLGYPEDLGDYDYDIDEITGFGKRESKEKRKERRAEVKEEKARVKEERKERREEKGKLLDRFKEKAEYYVKHPGQALKDSIVAPLTKFNPILAASRGSLLVVLRVNFRNLAGRLAVGYLREDELATEDIPRDVWEKVKEAVAKTENMYKKVGGDPDKLKDAIMIGKHRKPFFGTPPKGISIDGLGWSEWPEEFTGLGQAGTSESAIVSAITAAGALIASIAGFMKQIKFKKESGGPMVGETPETAENPEKVGTFNLKEWGKEQGKKLLERLSPQNQGYNTDDERKYVFDELTEKEPSEDKKDKTGLYLGIGAGVLVVIGLAFFAFKGK